MKAVLCKEFGNPTDLVIEEVESKPPLEGEVKIAVHACGVNFADIVMIKGEYQVKPPLPFTPGLEIAGEIMQVGAAVKHLKEGDRVIGICNDGGFAEEVNISAKLVLPMPPTMDFVTGAAFPIAYGTSHVALTHRANLQAGETLLVGGASGGVGLTAVELGKVLGAVVIAAASSDEKLNLARKRGADFTINYTTEDVRQRVKEITDDKGADVIYDPVGGEFFNQAMRSIKWEGRMLVIGFASGNIPEIGVNRLLVKNCAVIGVYWGAYALNDPKIMRESFNILFDLYTRGKLKPQVTQTYPLENAVDALQAIVNRQSTGKLVLTTGRS